MAHTIYIAGNLGNDLQGEAQKVIKALVKSSKKEEKEITLLVPGSFLQHIGFPKNRQERRKQKEILTKYLLKPFKDFNGKIILTPGYNEWANGSQQQIDDLESFLQDNESKIEVWPNDGCPLARESIAKNVELITVDSQWFLEDWDQHPEMNVKCEIKDRERFFTEFKDDIKDNHGKTIIVSVPHPVMSNTRKGFLEKISGFDPQDYHNKNHTYFRGRLETIASQFDDIIFVSANDRNLQFLQDDKIPQIISGAIGSKQKSKIKENNHFASTTTGFARMEIYNDHSSQLTFHTLKNNNTQIAFSTGIKRRESRMDEVSYKTKEQVGDTVSASIYSEEETDKSKLYKIIWGEHYRKVYSTKIKAPVLFLDTLNGNLKPLKEGGGMQSRSLRFIADDKNEFTIRALRKSATRFLQAATIKDHYIKDYIENTVAQRYALDLFTTAHPYAPFSLNRINQCLDILHGKPQIFYIPKQKTLGTNNDDYGDELYMFEAHVGDENKEFTRFGKSKDILSTTDFLKALNESKKNQPNEVEYIKARLLDMLIGDWDRHFDQWRWAEYAGENDKKVYKPIPRDRDFAFPKYDGPILNLMKVSFPLIRKMETFDNNVDNVKWFNLSGYPLDQKLLKTTSWNDWKEQVIFIQEKLTDAEIEQAFKILPREVQDHTIADIKTKLKARRGNLKDIARRYYDYLQKFQVLTGTIKDDVFNIERNKNGLTKISLQNKKGKETFSKTYNRDKTEEIWIYGLEGDDNFLVKGKGDNLIRISVVGGEGTDSYNFKNTKRITLYDHKSKKSEISNKNSKKWLVDSYKINQYDPDKRKRSENKLLPQANYKGDEGLSLGLRNIHTTYGLANNPFKTQHELGAAFFFATNGLEIDYQGEFAHIFYNWNLGISARYTSPNFTLNYFGKGIESEYNRDEMGRDFNRTRTQQLKLAPSLIWKGREGHSFYTKPYIEGIKAYDDDNRYLGQFFNPENDVFNQQWYAGAEANYNYKNRDNPAYPTRGFETNLTAGYKSNIDNHNNSFAYVEPSIALDYPLHHSDIAVLATKIGGKALFGDNYEFYHAALLGGNDDLRAYRLERFNGKQSFYHSTDLRVGLTQFKTNFIPLRMGLSAGFDYGRVWTENDNSKKWRNNYGGSFWVNGFHVVTANVGYYYGEDRGRLSFTFNFKF